jgi:6-pyruvoyltetrahydropterin/6-carboxytetrahydropterin synthase
MFRLTREVRFAINETPDDQLSRPPSNSYGGYPSLTGFGQYFRVQVCLEGQLDSHSQYLRNIKDVDQAVREKLVGFLGVKVDVSGAFGLIRDFFAPEKVHSLTIHLTPLLSVAQFASELDMTRLSQKFEFSASHRLHNPKLTEDLNRKTYGKCNNPNGHGHNYEVQVTLRGKPTGNGLLVDVPAFELIVKEFAIDKLDHKNLNLDVPEFGALIPTVENISMVVFKMLRNRFTSVGAELASVTVWETPKTWCEYSE